MGFNDIKHFYNFWYWIVLFCINIVFTGYSIIVNYLFYSKLFSIFVLMLSNYFLTILTDSI